MMIELQKYTKIDEDHLIKRVGAHQTDSRLKVAGYVTLALTVSLLGLSFVLGRTMFLSTEERALKVFDGDSDTPSMKEFVAFIAQHGKTYSGRTETALRYSNFLENREAVRKTKEHEFHLSYRLTTDN